jgi:hypothetical protein
MGHSRGWQPGSKVLMMIIRPPQQGQAFHSAGKGTKVGLGAKPVDQLHQTTGRLAPPNGGRFRARAPRCSPAPPVREGRIVTMPVMIFNEYHPHWDVKVAE